MGSQKVEHNRVTKQSAEQKEPLLRGKPCWESSVSRGPALHNFVVVVVWSLSRVQLFCDPMDWDYPGKNTGVDCHFLLPNPGIEPESLSLQGDSLSSEPPGKPLAYFGPILF